MFRRISGSSSSPQPRADELEDAVRKTSREVSRAQKMEKSGHNQVVVGKSMVAFGAGATLAGVGTLNPFVFVPGAVAGTAGVVLRDAGHAREQFGAALERHASRRVEPNTLRTLGFSGAEVRGLMTAMETAGVLLHFELRLDDSLRDEFFALAQNKNIGAVLRQASFSKFPAAPLKALGTYLRGVEEKALVLDMQMAAQASLKDHIEHRNQEAYRVLAQTSMQISGAWNSDGREAVDVGTTFTQAGDQEALIATKRRAHELRTLIAAEKRKPWHEQDPSNLGRWGRELKKLQPAEEPSRAVPAYDEVEDSAEAWASVFNADPSTEKAAASDAEPTHSALEDLAGLKFD